jgi:protein-disulfide isomerase
MNKRLWVVFAVVVIAAVGGLIWYSRSTSTSVGVDYFAENNYTTTKAITSDALTEAYKFDNPDASQDDAVNFANSQIVDHTFGNKDAKVVVVMYEDFACSVCYAYDQSSFEPLIQQYQDSVLFIYRHFSIGAATSTITQAASEAAGKLGGETAFWSMKSMLFDRANNDICTEATTSTSDCRSTIIGYAKQLGLDEAKYTELLDNATTNGIRDKTRRDYDMGIKAGVTGTPSWFINGKNITPSDGSAEQTIKDALAAAGVDPEEATTTEEPATDTAS